MICLILAIKVSNRRPNNKTGHHYKKENELIKCCLHTDLFGKDIMVIHTGEKPYGHITRRFFFPDFRFRWNLKHLGFEMRNVLKVANILQVGTFYLNPLYRKGASDKNIMCYGHVCF